MDVKKLKLIKDVDVGDAIYDGIDNRLLLVVKKSVSSLDSHCLDCGETCAGPVVLVCFSVVGRSNDTMTYCPDERCYAIA